MNDKERIYYNSFAKDYHLKRKHPWKPFLDFIEEYIGQGKFHLIKKGICVDLGCANGRHFEVINSDKNHIIGIDSSIAFLSIAKKEQKISDSQTMHLCCADMNNLPFRERSVDLILSIAALHHIKTKKRRRKVMQFLSAILKEHGHILFSVWRRWQKKFFKFFLKDKVKRIFCPKYRKRQTKQGLTDFGDKIVPWTVSQTKETIHRFYHLFSKRETLKLCKNFQILEFKAIGGPNNRDNFFVLCGK